MHIHEVRTDKKRYLPLLLLADEQESMIDRYLDRGRLFVLEDCGVKNRLRGDRRGKRRRRGQKSGHRAGSTTAGLWPRHAGLCRRGLPAGAHGPAGRDGRQPADPSLLREMRVPPLAYRQKNFFTDHYDHPIYEGGRQLIDMIYLRKPL